MKRKILIVDDDTHLARVVSVMLESTGKYEIRVVTDGLQATTVARDFFPDIALLDVQMPGISGREIARQLAQNVLTRNAAVVFLTSLLRKAGQMSKEDLDGWPVLGKPASLDELNQAIDAALARRNKEKQ